MNFNYNCYFLYSIKFLIFFYDVLLQVYMKILIFLKIKFILYIIERVYR